MPSPPAASEPSPPPPPPQQHQQRKSDAATSWRRASSSTSSRSSPSPPLQTPTVVVSTPEDIFPSPTSPMSASTAKSAHRPSPLQLLEQQGPRVIEFSDSEEEEEEEELGTQRTDSDSPPALSDSPTNSSPTSLSPTHATTTVAAAVAETPTPKRSSFEVAFRSAVTRQPKGPPSGAEDLGARNFASRIRRRAIGGLGALMDARKEEVGMF